jgi:hypothetical protein
MKRLILVTAIICTSMVTCFAYNHNEVLYVNGGDSGTMDVSINANCEVLLGAFLTEGAYADFRDNDYGGFERLIYGPNGYNSFVTRTWGTVRIYISALGSTGTNWAGLFWN